MLRHALVAWSFIVPLAGTALAADVDPSWQEAALGNLAAAEYRFTWHDGLPSAPNRAQDLRTTVDPDGITVVSRTRGAEGFTFRLALLDHGAGVLDAGARASLRREGVTEWLANDALGLTHGLTLDRKLPDLAFALGGDAAAYPEGDAGRSVLLRNGRGEAVVRYGGIAAVDAVGRDVPVRIALGPSRLSLVLEDDGAAYPITIRALATSPVWNVTINQAGAGFGNAVSTAGDVDGDGFSDVIVGAYAYDEGQVDEGKAFVFLGSALGLSTSPAWSAQSNQGGGNLGSSVAAAGDVNNDGYGDVIVGAYTYDEGQFDEGAAFVWLGGPGGLGALGTPANADWAKYGNQDGANFGTRVARAGDVNRDGFDDVAVTAFHYDSVHVDDGAAFVYHGGPAGPAASPSWTKLYESDPGAATFGSAVSGAGDVNGDGYDDLIVGADHDSDSLQFQGSVHLFYGSPTGLGALVWAVYGFQQGGQLGASVAGIGDVNGDGLADIAAGAPFYDTTAFRVDDGKVLVWFGRPTVPNTPQDMSVNSGQDDAHLGTAIAAAGDVNGDGFADFIVGAPGNDVTQPDEGRAFLYQGALGSPGGSASWTAEGGQSGANLGISVGPAGDVNGDGYSDVIVGVWSWNDTQADSGNARVYHGGPSGPRSSADWANTPGQAFAEYGWGVASAGDVNADGFSDVIVGAPKFDLGEPDEGCAFVFHGAAGGLGTTAAFTIQGNQAGAWLGQSVAGAGDVNGDGYADVIVGALKFDDGQTDEGAVWVYRGGPSGLTGVNHLLEVDQAGAFLGWAVAGAGDVNGDGYADVIAGANWWDGSQTDQGATFVALGSASGPGPLVRFGTGIAQASSHFGYALAGAGDVNRDGFSDVVVGVPEWDGPAGSDAGKAFLFYGSAAGLSDAAAPWSPDGGHFDWELGLAVASAGDVNGDGYADVILSVPFYTNGEAGEGGAFVYLGGPGGPTSPPAWSFTADQANAFLGAGTGVASAGDVNGDGYSDVVVGALSWQSALGDWAGKAWVFLGSATGLATAPAWSVTGASNSNQLGNSVASAGDVDGDGYSDVLIGEWCNSEGGNPIQGKAWIYYGNGGRGRPRTARQMTGSGGRFVAPLGVLDTDLAFRSVFNLAVPAGRERTGVQIEIKPVGTPFNGTGLIDIAPVDASGSLNASFTLGGFSPLTSYHWRIRLARGRNPAYVRSPWFGIADTSRALLDFRTPCGVVPWYRDLDGDLHGNAAVSVSACTQPAGYVANTDDCDDNNAARFPGNPEVCDAVDNDCDMLVDEFPPPAGSNALDSISRSGTSVIFSWTALPGATRYTIVRGGLGVLRSTGGNFTAAVSLCLADSGGWASDTPAPPAGDGSWYLVRGVACNTPGTYDDGSASQAGSRDPEILTCP